MVEQQVVAAIEEIMDINKMFRTSPINLADTFIDLGFDSLTMAELTCHFERIAGCRLRIDDLMEIETVQEAIDLIKGKSCTKDLRIEHAK